MSGHLSVAEIAADTGLSRDVVYRAIRAGELRARKLHSRVIVPAEDYQRWLEDHVIQPDPMKTAQVAGSRRSRRRAAPSTGDTVRATLKAIEGGAG